jgi:hypothetical protein
MLDIRVPLNDPAPAQKLIDQCATIEPLQMLGATVANGTCTIPLPQAQMTVEAWIDGKTLRLGQKQAKPPAVTAPMSPAGKELAGGEWIMAMWGRGTVFSTMKLPPIVVDQLGPEVLAVVRAVSLLNELGLGVRVDGDKLRFLVDVRTAYANPDDVLARFLAIPSRQFFTGEASTTAKQIADAAPKSPFAGDFAAGYGGLMVPAAGVGMVAAIAVPAFTDYMRKSKQSEASLQLHRLERNLEVAAMADGGFPKGKIGLTPSTSCCESGGKCSDPAAWQDPMWKSLDFAIEEPHMYRYAYESDGKTFTATAVTDLDCDGVEVSYKLTGTLDAQGNVKTRLETPAPN